MTKCDPDPGNPHVKFENTGGRGYVRVTLSRSKLYTDYRVVDSVEQPECGIRTLASLAVEAGKPGVRRG